MPTTGPSKKRLSHILTFSDVSQAPAVTTPNTETVSVTSASYDGADINVEAVSSGTCTDLTLHYAAATTAFNADCQATISGPNFPADGTTVNITSSADYVEVHNFPITMP